MDIHFKQIGNEKSLYYFVSWIVVNIILILEKVRNMPKLILRYPAIFANNAALGGHVKIGHNVMLGGFASVQQWCRVGDHAMVGSQTAVDADVIPFAIAVGNRASLTGINVIGLERRGFDAIDVDLLRQAFRDLFHRDGLFSERLGRMRDIYEKNPLVGQIISFIDGAGKNGICKTASKVTKRG